jgi:hypothetical protein
MESGAIPTEASMALPPRTAAWLVVLATALAFPLPVAARSRTVGAKAKKPNAAAQTVRSQRPLRRAAPAEVGAGQREEGSHGDSDLNAIVRWEDRDGAVHYAPGYAVPQSSRSKVRRVYTSVGVVPLDRTEAAKPPPSREHATSTAGFPAITLPPAPVPPPADAPQRVPSGSPQGPTTGPSQPAPAGTSR